MSDIATVRKAFLDTAEASKAVGLLRAKSSESSSLKVKIDEEISKLTHHESRDAARRFLDGDESAPPKPERRRKLAALREKRAAAIHALPLIQEDLQPLLKAQADASATLIEAVVAHTHAERIRAVAAIQAALAETVGPLVVLIAADRIQEEMIGAKFPARVVLPVFSGRHVATTFLKAVADRIRPNSLSIDSIERSANSLAVKWMAEIKGDVK